MYVTIYFLIKNLKFRIRGYEKVGLLGIGCWLFKAEWNLNLEAHGGCYLKLDEWICHLAVINCGFYWWNDKGQLCQRKDVALMLLQITIEHYLVLFYFILLLFIFYFSRHGIFMCNIVIRLLLHMYLLLNYLLFID